MVYKIITFDMIGKKLFTYEPMPFLQKIEDKFSHAKFVDENGHEYMKSHLWKLSTEIPAGAFPNTVEFLPYFADVEEDLPGSIKLEPKTFHNCQLMREKHNGYLQFYHKPTDQVLRIAMNSNIYHPITK